MASEEGNSNDANSLIQEMLRQVSTLQEKVDTIQKKSVMPSEVGDSDDKMEGSSGSLLELWETTKAFLEAAFLATTPNEDRRKRVGKVEITDCDKIRCPKRDGVVKAVLPKDAIKADGYLSHLQQFWLDVVAPLWLCWKALGRGFDARKGGFSHPDCLVLNGECALADGTEMEKEADLKLNPFLKFMAEDNKTLFLQHQCCLGRIC